MSAPRWRPVIGLELHVQLRTESKLFSRVASRSSGRANTRVDPVSAGLPGALPVLNSRAVELAARLALALDMRLQPLSHFDRKHYFYPDLPKNYQITQHFDALAKGGELRVGQPGVDRRVRLRRLHLEEDAARTLDRDGATFVDLNRAGCPLAELVTEPCIDEPRVAGAFLEDLRHLVRWLHVSDGNMEDGNLRCDANISVHGPGGSSPRVELKNLNSISAVVRGLEYEAERLGAAMESGIALVDQTRRWDASGGRSEAMRDKESGQEYMFLPEPDLPPLRVEDHEVFRLRSTLGELPWERRYRLSEVFGLPDEYLDQLGREREVSDYFLRVVEGLGEGPEMPARARRAARWMVGEWSREMARYEGGAEACPVDASSLAAWLLEVERRPAPHALQTAFLEAMFREGLAATQWAGFARSYRVGAEELRSVVLRVLEVHPEQRRRYRGGKSGLLDFFVGQVLRESPEGSDPVLVRELCEKELGA